MNKDYVIEQIKKELGDNYEVTFTQVQKEYALLEGISIREDSKNIAANIYYDSEDTDDSIVSHVLRTFKESVFPNVDVDELSENLADWNWIKERIVPALYNKDKNTREGIVSVDVAGDISVMFRIILDTNDNGRASIVAMNNYAEKWGVSIEEILKTAKANLNKELYILDMEKIMAEMMGMSDEVHDGRTIEEGDMMTVASNISKTNGASSILLFSDLIESGEIDDRDYYILPSSVHEVIYLREYDEGFATMVKEVNAQQVAPPDFLSDHVFKYNHETKQIEAIA